VRMATTSCDERASARARARAYATYRVYNNERDAALGQPDERFAELPKLLRFDGIV
jgi:hypothetical protein